MKKHAIVTGMTRGIGHAIALALAKKGYAIAGCGTRDQDHVQDVLDEIRAFGTDVVYVSGDLANEDTTTRLLDAAVPAFGPPNLLVNNAGIAPRVRADILDVVPADYDRVMDVNLKSAFFLTQQCAKIMIDSKQRKEKSMIIMISSISAYVSSVNRAAYCLSKAGLSMMTQLYADRLAAHDIAVHEIRPGLTRTDMTEKVREKYDAYIEDGINPIARWGTPSDVADAVTMLLDHNLFTTGQIINVDGGYHIRRL